MERPLTWGERLAMILDGSWLKYISQKADNTKLQFDLDQTEMARKATEKYLKEKRRIEAEMAKLSPEDLEKLRGLGRTTTQHIMHRKVLEDLAEQFGIPKDMLDQDSVRESLDFVLNNGVALLEKEPDFWNDPVYVAARAEMDTAIEQRDTEALLDAQRKLNEYVKAQRTMPPYRTNHRMVDITTFRKEWDYMEINSEFLLDFRDALIDVVGKNGLAFTMSKVKGPQGEDLVLVTKGVNLSPRKAVLFLEAHMTHLGVALTGSTGQIYEGAEFITVQLLLAAPIRLPPEILSVTPDKPCPEPELTLFCDGEIGQAQKSKCGFKVVVPETEAPARTQEGCHQCGTKELRYELCYADGTPLESSNYHHVLDTGLVEDHRFGRLNEQRQFVPNATWSTAAIPPDLSSSIGFHGTAHSHGPEEDLIPFDGPEPEEDPMDEILRMLT